MRAAVRAAHLAQQDALAVVLTVGAILAVLALSPFPAAFARFADGRLSRTVGRGLLATLVVGAALCGRLAALAVLEALWPDPLRAHALAGAASGLLVDLALFGAALFGVVTVLEAAPRRGLLALCLLSTVLAALAFLAPPFLIEPAIRGDTPAPAGAGAALLALVRADGAPVRTLYVFKSADPTAVDVEAVGPFARLAVSQAALDHPRPETFAALGHLLGHAVHQDLVGFVVLVSVLSWALLFALSRFWDRRTAFLPLAALSAWALFPVQVAAFNLYDRTINIRADAHALKVSRDPRALCRWLIADSPPGDPDPGLFEEVFFDSHPPLGLRLRNALAGAPPAGP